jgi:hypothetical protein
MVSMSTLTPIGERLQIALDGEYVRMQNEWFFKWHHIGGVSVIEIDGFDGRMIRYAGIKFSGTARAVYWGTIQLYARKKVGELFDELESDLKRYPVEIRAKALIETEAFIRIFAVKIRNAAVEKDRVLRGDGFQFPPPQDLGHWSGAQESDIESRAATLRHTYIATWSSPRKEGKRCSNICFVTGFRWLRGTDRFSGKTFAASSLRVRSKSTTPRCPLRWEIICCANSPMA